MSETETVTTRPATIPANPTLSTEIAQSCLTEDLRQERLVCSYLMRDSGSSGTISVHTDLAYRTFDLCEWVLAVVEIVKGCDLCGYMAAEIQAEIKVTDDKDAAIVRKILAQEKATTSPAMRRQSVALAAHRLRLARWRRRRAVQLPLTASAIPADNTAD